MFFASVSDACFKRFIYLETMLQVLYLDVSKIDRVFASFSSLFAASHWCLILALCCLASFSDCGGGATRADEGGCAGVRRTGRAGVLQRERERTLSPSGMLRWSYWWATTSAHGSVGWGLGDASGHAAGAERPGASAPATYVSFRVIVIILVHLTIISFRFT